AVGVEPARGEADEQVAGTDGAAVDDAVLLHDAHRETRQVVVAGGIHSGHLRRLAADQRGPRLAAALGNSPDHRFAVYRIEPGSGEVVEKEQRFGAANHDIVHAHGDEIDADGVVAVELD